MRVLCTVPSYQTLPRQIGGGSSEIRSLLVYGMVDTVYRITILPYCIIIQYGSSDPNDSQLRTDLPVDFFTGPPLALLISEVDLCIRGNFILARLWIEPLLSGTAPYKASNRACADADRASSLCAAFESRGVIVPTVAVSDGLPPAPAPATTEPPPPAACCALMEPWAIRAVHRL